MQFMNISPAADVWWKQPQISCHFFILVQSDEDDHLYVFPQLYQMGTTQTVTAAAPWVCLAYATVQKQYEKDQFEGVCVYLCVCWVEYNQLSSPRLKYYIKLFPGFFLQCIQITAD